MGYNGRQEIFAITGAKGTGKSSVLWGLRTRLSAALPARPCHLVESPGRGAQDSGLPLGELGSDATHIYFADRHLKAIAEAGSGVTLLDRCFVDHLAYVRLLTENASLHSLMERIMGFVAPSYVSVFFCPLHDELPEPLPRTESRDFRQQVETEILSIIGTYGVRAIFLPTKLDEACDIVWREIMER